MMIAVVTFGTESRMSFQTVNPATGEPLQTFEALANATPFGLGGSVFTADVERGLKVATQPK
jgi:hypothetical protein